MPTNTHIRWSAAAAFVVAAALLVAPTHGAQAAANDATGYGWPVKPFDQPHPVRGNFGDPRTIFAGPPTQRTLLSGLSVALQWVCDEGGVTLQRLIDGKPIASKTEQEIEEANSLIERRLEQLRQEGKA